MIFVMQNPGVLGLSRRYVSVASAARGTPSNMLCMQLNQGLLL